MADDSVPRGDDTFEEEEVDESVRGNLYGLSIPTAIS